MGAGRSKQESKYDDEWEELDAIDEEGGEEKEEEEEEGGGKAKGKGLARSGARSLL